MKVIYSLFIICLVSLMTGCSSSDESESATSIVNDPEKDGKVVSQNLPDEYIGDWLDKDDCEMYIEGFDIESLIALTKEGDKYFINGLYWSGEIKSIKKQENGFYLLSVTGFEEGEAFTAPFEVKIENSKLTFKSGAEPKVLTNALKCD